MTNKQPTGIEEIEKLAKLMHDTYEDKAREFGWSTQKKTRVAFRDLPESNKRTMLAVAEVVYATIRREAVEECMEIVNKKMSSLGWHKYWNDREMFDAVGCRGDILEDMKDLINLKEKPQ